LILSKDEDGQGRMGVRKRKEKKRKRNNDEESEWLARGHRSGNDEGSKTIHLG